MAMSNWNAEFDKYVNHYSFYQKNDDTIKIDDEMVKVIGSDMGRNVGFDRVAVHHHIIPPGFRSSLPHAESLEEEFVFVLKGNIDLWLNGFISHLSSGHAVGFPAGTGEAHCFINNSSQDVHLLVAGERSKNDNLCAFPINPELKEDCAIWWDDFPKHRLGPHNGEPGPVETNCLSIDKSDRIFYCPDFKKEESFNYPGDNETFSSGFRITDKLGLKALGISYECLEPGKRSAFPHAHTHEEEFVYVIKGEPTVWLNGYDKKLGEGDFAAFPSNTGLAHVIVNETNEDIYYICIGETQDFPDEKIIYPLNPLRNKEYLAKGWYWLDAPQKNMGTHPAKVSHQKGHINFTLCSESNADKIFDIFKSSPEYFEKVEGCQPSIELAKKFILDRPDKTIESYYNEFLIINYEGEQIGVLELHLNHPEDKHGYIGLFLLKNSHQGRGLGKACYLVAEDYMKRALGCDKIRLGVSEFNNVGQFWQKMGFKLNGNSFSWHGEKKNNQVLEYEKVIKGELSS